MPIRTAVAFTHVVVHEGVQRILQVTPSLLAKAQSSALGAQSLGKLEHLGLGVGEAGLQSVRFSRAHAPVTENIRGTLDRGAGALGPEMQTDDSACPPDRRDLSKETLLEL